MSSKQPDIDGQNVQAAPNYNVKVDEADFAKAVPGDQFKCALVWAIRRKYPKAKRIRVNMGSVSFTIDEQRFHYPADESIVEHVIRPLDTGQDPTPTTVRLHDGYVTQVEYTDEEKLIEQRTNRLTKVAELSRRGQNNSASYRRLK